MTMGNDPLRSSLEQDLNANNYHVDDHDPHLAIKAMENCRQCQHRPCAAICPALVFLWEKDQMVVQYSGCLECGACRFICPRDNIDWRFPHGGYGVLARLG